MACREAEIEKAGRELSWSSDQAPWLNPTVVGLFADPYCEDLQLFVDGQAGAPEVICRELGSLIAGLALVLPFSSQTTLRGAVEWAGSRLQQVVPIPPDSSLAVLVPAVKSKLIALTQGDVFVQVCGWYHKVDKPPDYVLLVWERTGKAEFALCVVNTGTGRGYHPSRAGPEEYPKSKVLCAWRLVGIAQELLVEDAFLHALLLPATLEGCHEKNNAGHLYEVLLPYLLPKCDGWLDRHTCKEYSKAEHYSTPQRAQLATFKCVSSCLRFLLARKGLCQAERKQLMLEVRRAVCAKLHKCFGGQAVCPEGGMPKAAVTIAHLAGRQLALKALREHRAGRLDDAGLAGVRALIAKLDAASGRTLVGEGKLNLGPIWRSTPQVSYPGFWQPELYWQGLDLVLAARSAKPVLGAMTVQTTPKQLDLVKRPSSREELLKSLLADAQALLEVKEDRWAAQHACALIEAGVGSSLLPLPARAHRQQPRHYEAFSSSSDSGTTHNQGPGKVSNQPSNQAGAPASSTSHPAVGQNPVQSSNQAPKDEGEPPNPAFEYEPPNPANECEPPIPSLLGKSRLLRPIHDLALMYASCAVQCVSQDSRIHLAVQVMTVASLLIMFDSVLRACPDSLVARALGDMPLITHDMLVMLGQLPVPDLRWLRIRSELHAYVTSQGSSQERFMDVGAPQNWHGRYLFQADLRQGPLKPTLDVMGRLLQLCFPPAQGVPFMSVAAPEALISGLAGLNTQHKDNKNVPTLLVGSFSQEQLLCAWLLSPNQALLQKAPEWPMAWGLNLLARWIGSPDKKLLPGGSPAGEFPRVSWHFAVSLQGGGAEIEGHLRFGGGPKTYPMAAVGAPAASSSMAAVKVHEPKAAEYDEASVVLLPGFSLEPFASSDSSLTGEEAERFLLALSVPPLRVPLLLRFFAESRVPTLKHKRLLAAFEAALFEPYLYDLDGPPAEAPCDPKHLGTKVGLLLHELQLNPHCVWQPLSEMLTDVRRLSKLVARDSEGADVVLALLRVVARIHKMLVAEVDSPDPEWHLTQPTATSWLDELDAFEHELVERLQQWFAEELQSRSIQAMRMCRFQAHVAMAIRPGPGTTEEDAGNVLQAFCYVNTWLLQREEEDQGSGPKVPLTGELGAEILGIGLSEFWGALQVWRVPAIRLIKGASEETRQVLLLAAVNAVAHGAVREDLYFRPSSYGYFDGFAGGRKKVTVDMQRFHIVFHEESMRPLPFLVTRSKTYTELFGDRSPNCRLTDYADGCVAHVQVDTQAYELHWSRMRFVRALSEADGFPKITRAASRGNPFVLWSFSGRSFKEMRALATTPPSPDEVNAALIPLRAAPLAMQALCQLLHGDGSAFRRQHSGLGNNKDMFAQLLVPLELPDHERDVTVLVGQSQEVHKVPKIGWLEVRLPRCSALEASEGGPAHCRHVVSVCELVDFNRAVARKEVWSSDCRLSLSHSLLPNALAQDKSPPSLLQHYAGKIEGAADSFASSLEVRRLDGANYVPTELLTGLIPGVFLEAGFRFWHQGDVLVAQAPAQASDWFNYALHIQSSAAGALISRVVGGSKQILVNALTAPDWSALARIARMLMPFEQLSHVLFWAGEDGVLVSCELPRMQLRFVPAETEEYGEPEELRDSTTAMAVLQVSSWSEGQAGGIPGSVPAHEAELLASLETATTVCVEMWRFRTSKILLRQSVEVEAFWAQSWTGMRRTIVKRRIIQVRDGFLQLLNESGTALTWSLPPGTWHVVLREGSDVRLSYACQEAGTSLLSRLVQSSDHKMSLKFASEDEAFAWEQELQGIRNPSHWTHETEPMGVGLTFGNLVLQSSDKKWTQVIKIGTWLLKEHSGRKATVWFHDADLPDKDEKGSTMRDDEGGHLLLMTWSSDDEAQVWAQRLSKASLTGGEEGAAKNNTNNNSNDKKNDSDNNDSSAALDGRVFSFQERNRQLELRNGALCLRCPNGAVDLVLPAGSWTVESRLLSKLSLRGQSLDRRPGTNFDLLFKSEALAQEWGALLNAVCKRARGQGKKARFESVEFDGFYALELCEVQQVDARGLLLAELLQGVPHHLILRHCSGQLKVLVPSAKPTRPIIKELPFTTRLVLDRSCIPRRACRVFSWDLHVAGGNLLPTTMLGTLYLCLLRFLNRDYTGIARMLGAVAFDIKLDDDESSIFSLFFSGPRNKIDMNKVAEMGGVSPFSQFAALSDLVEHAGGVLDDRHPDACALRLRLAIAAQGYRYEFRQSLYPFRSYFYGVLPGEFAEYLSKLTHVSQECRLTYDEEHRILLAISALSGGGPTCDMRALLVKELRANPPGPGHDAGRIHRVMLNWDPGLGNCPLAEHLEQAVKCAPGASQEAAVQVVAGRALQVLTRSVIGQVCNLAGSDQASSKPDAADIYFWGHHVNPGDDWIQLQANVNIRKDHYGAESSKDGCSIYKCLWRKNELLQDDQCAFAQIYALLRGEATEPEMFSQQAVTVPLSELLIRGLWFEASHREGNLIKHRHNQLAITLLLLLLRARRRGGVAATSCWPSLRDVCLDRGGLASFYGWIHLHQDWNKGNTPNGGNVKEWSRKLLVAALSEVAAHGALFCRPAGSQVSGQPQAAELVFDPQGGRHWPPGAPRVRVGDDAPLWESSPLGAPLGDLLAAPLAAQARHVEHRQAAARAPVPLDSLSVSTIPGGDTPVGQATLQQLQQGAAALCAKLASVHTLAAATDPWQLAVELRQAWGEDVKQLVVERAQVLAAASELPQDQLGDRTWLDQRGGAVQPWMEWCLSAPLYVLEAEDSGQSSFLGQLQVVNPLALESHVQAVKEGLARLLCRAGRAGLLQRALTTATGLVHDPKRRGAAELAEILSCRRQGDSEATYVNADGSFDYRFLLFEYVSGFFLKTQQTEIVRDLYTAQAEEEPRVVQMIMGGGKTACVTPLLALLLAHEQRLVVAVVPDPLLAQTRNIMRQLFGSLLGRQVGTLEFSREVGKDRSKEYAHEPCCARFACEFLKGASHGSHCCEGCRKGGGHDANCARTPIPESRVAGVSGSDLCARLLAKLNASMRGCWPVMSTPSAVKSLVLKFLELQIESRHTVQESSATLGKVLLLLRQHAVALVDEVDWVLHPLKSELNFPLGIPVPFDETELRVQLTLHLVDGVLLSLGDEKSASTHVAFKNWETSEEGVAARGMLQAATQKGLEAKAMQAKPHFVLHSPQFYAEHLLRPLATWVIGWARTASPVASDFHPSSLVPPTSSEFVDYLQAQQVYGSPLLAVESQLGDGAKRLLTLARSWLHHLLPHLLSKGSRVSFGLLNSAERRAAEESQAPRSRVLLAVPFVAKDAPASAAEFAHPDVLIGYTVLAYRHEGLRPQDMAELVQARARRARLEPGPYATRSTCQHFKGWLQRAQVATDNRDLKFLAVPELPIFGFVAGPELFRSLWELLRHSTEVIHWYLTEMVFPAVLRQQERKLMASGQEIGSEMIFRGRLGFSGTPSSLLPRELGQCHFDLENVGEILATLLDSAIVAPEVRVLGDGWSTESFLRELATARPAFSALIDTGALITELSNEQVAQKLLAFLPGSFAGVVFLGVHDEQLIVQRGVARPTPLKESGIPPDRRFCFYDQVHCTGIDVKHRSDARAAITLSASLTYRDLAQGAWRMRGIGKGQTILLCCTPEIRCRIEEVVGSSSGCSPLSCVEALRFLLANSFSSEQKQFVALQLQNLGTIWRKRALQDVLESNTDALSELEDKLVFPVSAGATAPQQLHEVMSEELRCHAAYLNCKDQADGSGLKASAEALILDVCRSSVSASEEGGVEEQKEKEAEKEVVAFKQVVVNVSQESHDVRSWEIKQLGAGPMPEFYPLRDFRMSGSGSNGLSCEEGIWLSCNHSKTDYEHREASETRRLKPVEVVLCWRSMEGSWQSCAISLSEAAALRRASASNFSLWLRGGPIGAREACLWSGSSPGSDACNKSQTQVLRFFNADVDFSHEDAVLCTQSLEKSGSLPVEREPFIQAIMGARRRDTISWDTSMLYKIVASSGQELRSGQNLLNVMKQRMGQVETLWSRLDVDGNLELTQDELQAVLVPLGFSFREVRTILEYVDVDRTGVLRLYEFEGAIGVSQHIPGLSGKHETAALGRAWMRRRRFAEIEAALREAVAASEEMARGGLACLVTCPSAVEVEAACLALAQENRAAVDLIWPGAGSEADLKEITAVLHGEGRSSSVGTAAAQHLAAILLDRQGQDSLLSDGSQSDDLLARAAAKVANLRASWLLYGQLSLETVARCAEVLDLRPQRMALSGLAILALERHLAVELCAGTAQLAHCVLQLLRDCSPPSALEGAGLIVGIRLAAADEALRPALVQQGWGRLASRLASSRAGSEVAAAAKWLLALLGADDPLGALGAGENYTRLDLPKRTCRAATALPRGSRLKVFAAGSVAAGWVLRLLDASGRALYALQVDYIVDPPLASISSNFDKTPILKTVDAAACGFGEKESPFEILFVFEAKLEVFVNGRKAVALTLQNGDACKALEVQDMIWPHLWTLLQESGESTHWQIFTNAGWIDMPKESSEALTAGKASGQQRVRFQAGRNAYDADLVRMVQINVKFRTERRIRPPLRREWQNQTSQTNQTNTSRV